MNIKNPLFSFFNTLMPTFSKSKVEDDLRAIRKELEEHTMPMLTIPAALGSDFFLVQEIDKELSKIGLRGNIWSELRDLLEKRLDEWEKLHDIIDKSFEKEINKDGMDYYRLQILFVASLYRFWGEYTRKLILVSAAESRGDRRGINKEYLSFILDTENRNAYIKVTELMKLSFRDVRTAAMKGKDITVSDVPDADSVQRRADGIKSNFIPVSLNPVLWFNRLANTIVSYRYDLTKQQKEALEMEIIYIQRKASGASEEELEEVEKTIKKMKSRISVLEAKLEDMQEE